MTATIATSNAYARTVPLTPMGHIPFSLNLLRPAMRPNLPTLPEPNAIVHIIRCDDETAWRARHLCAAICADVRVYDSAAAFMAADLPQAPGCLIVQVRLPLIGELELIAGFQSPEVRLPMIVTADQTDVRTAVLAMKLGAVDFLEYPLQDEHLVDAVDDAIRADRMRHHAETHRAELKARFDKLTMRERQVMALVTEGLLNKQVAGELGLSEITVKVHRGSMMRKMAARTLADLVRMADMLASWIHPTEELA
ncbi:response regulator transcription factor [Rhizorhabdus argentea]|uniref:response regulator transcription factor n=1 Tax=Rhizorhabdus argentea TaxID=1387174 RepID=UPI0030EE123F